MSRAQWCVPTITALGRLSQEHCKISLRYVVRPWLKKGREGEREGERERKEGGRRVRSEKCEKYLCWESSSISQG